MNIAAAEVAGCVRDTMAALRTLPRLLLSPPPVTRVAPMRYPCVDNPSGKVSGYQMGTDFIHAMLRAVPGLYAKADFFNAHPYPIRNEPFSTPKGRAGTISYRAQLDASALHTAPPLSYCLYTVRFPLRLPSRRWNRRRLACGLPSSPVAPARARLQLPCRPARIHLAAWLRGDGHLT